MISHSKTVQLKDLEGIHSLDAVDMGTSEREGMLEEILDAQHIRFRLDGVLYVAYEDPMDGYRSCIKDIEILENARIKNVFPSIMVKAELDEEVLYFKDLKSGEVVMEIGTIQNEWYPSFIARFDPKGIFYNIHQ